MVIKVKINDKTYNRDILPHLRLIDFLRYNLLLTGTKEGCGDGECGACTVLLDQKPVNSCLILAAQTQDREILTIEGIRETETGQLLIAFFSQLGAIQCGFCTPGIIVTSYALIVHNTSLSIDDVRKGLSGHLCRCTGYQKIVEAVLNAFQVVHQNHPQISDNRYAYDRN